MIANRKNLQPTDKVQAIAQLKALYELGNNNMIVADAANSTIIKAALGGQFGKAILHPATIATFLTAAGVKVATQIIGSDKLGPALEKAIKQKDSAAVQKILGDQNMFQELPSTKKGEKTPVTALEINGPVVFKFADMELKAKAGSGGIEISKNGRTKSNKK
tara:strand:- start:206 stop:691 length:486 start_codon:yes stop_codon:yes gene_type:complete